jgi:sulfoxide reductase heme-binding subunit YedZ
MYHHGSLALLSGGALLLVTTLIHADDAIFKLSMATAYVALALLVATLLLGPLNLLRARPNPVSTDLRRDIGIWAGVAGLAHVVFGFQMHFHGRPWLYVLAEQPQAIPIRMDAFGLTNILGLIATFILIVLLTISNDYSLRSLGRARWKRLQQLNYGLIALVGLHGAIYQMLERRTLVYVAIFGALLLIVVAVQLMGIGRRRAWNKQQNANL